MLLLLLVSAAGTLGLEGSLVAGCLRVRANGEVRLGLLLDVSVGVVGVFVSSGIPGGGEVIWLAILVGF
eukprot:m.184817 g.184817  ORF g.184817 m.184817 type:complete len:69 (+) comp14720_c1_seq1:262-468(+)